MNIFADYHHGGLYYSLELLTKRLDSHIFRPIGTEWFSEGYFKIAEPYGNHPDTIKQYLSTEPHEEVPFYCNSNASQISNTGIYLITDYAHENAHFAMNLEAFKASKFDVILVTYAPHLPSWIELRDKYQLAAKIVLQVGNHGWENYFPLIDNILSSTRYTTPQARNYVEYHQEFPLDLFSPTTLHHYGPSLTSFVNCTPRLEYIQALQAALPFYKFKLYGGGSPDGAITGQSKIADTMHASMWGLHVKPGGDGYGHVLHNWAAIGKPVLTFFSDYAGKMGSDLLIDRKTAINLTGNPSYDASLISSVSTDEWKNMCRNMTQRFREVVDFDKEEIALRGFFSNLL